MLLYILKLFNCFTDYVIQKYYALSNIKKTNLIYQTFRENQLQELPSFKI